MDTIYIEAVLRADLHRSVIEAEDTPAETVTNKAGNVTRDDRPSSQRH